MQDKVRVVEIPWWNRGITWFFVGLFVLAAIYGMTRPEGSPAQDTRKTIAPSVVLAPTPERVAPPKPVVIGGTPGQLQGNTGVTIGTNNGTVNVTYGTPAPKVIERVVEKPVLHVVEKIVEKPVYVDHYIKEVHTETFVPRDTPKDIRAEDPCDRGQREHEARVAKWRTGR